MDRSGNLIGAGGIIMMSAGSADNCKSLASFGPCLNARASIVSKQVGADPHLPGPGQYINPLTEGRNGNGEYKALLSTQMQTYSVSFGPCPSEKGGGRSLAKKGAENEPAPDQYQDFNEGRGPNGEVKRVLSTQRGMTSIRFGSGEIDRSLAAPGSALTPGPGAYVNPLKEGRNEKGEVKAVLSTQKTTTSCIFAPPNFMSGTSASRKKINAGHSTPGPGAYINPVTDGRDAQGCAVAVLSTQRSQAAVGFGNPVKGDMRSMARPGAADEPGPGQYIDPLTEGRNAAGEVKPVSSRERSVPSAVFTRALARPKEGAWGANERRPGPGQYELPTAMGKQVKSQYKSMAGARWGPAGR